MMLPNLVLILPLLVTSSSGDCGGGQWPTHVYEARTEILEGDKVISRDNTTFEIYKDENRTILEQISARATTFDDYENEDAIQDQQETLESNDSDSDDESLENSSDAEVGDGFQSFSGMSSSDDDDDDDDYSDEDEMDDWTKRHYKKIKGLRLLQNVTQDLVLPQSGNLFCWANVCHDVEVVIHRVEIVAIPGVTIQCLDGSVGSYKMVFEVKGQPGESAVMTSKMWGAYARTDRYIWVTSGDWPYECGEVISHC